MCEEATMTDPVTRLGELARQRDGAIDSNHDARGREALVHALAGERTPRRRLARPVLAAAAIVLAAVLVIVAWPDGTLEYEVTGAVAGVASADAGYVRAADAPARIAFSDGSAFELDAGSAGRVTDVDEDGARLVLERGSLRADVVHTGAAHWTVSAGPYSIAVTGTEFSVRWQPDVERIEIHLLEGSVTVSGPMAEPALAMHTGQRLVAYVGRRDLQLSEGTPEAVAAPSVEPSAATASVPEPAPSAAASATPSASTTAPEPAPVSWSGLIAAGKYEQVMRLARGMGIGSVLSSGSQEQLVALGDAARYTGDGGTSRKVLLALRDRFPTSGAAKTAAFLLGRMAEGGSPSAAIRWYDRYLAESPGGTYGSEALGRKMVLLSRSQPARARAVARQYLQLYPKGSYAHVARKLTK
jgi:hypothetical protein